MPSFDQISNNQKSANTSYDKLLAIFSRDDEHQSVASRNGRAVVVLKTEEDYETSIATMPSGLYQQSAGSDLSALLMPYETHLGASSMPAFYQLASASGGISIGEAPKLIDILPIRWDKDDTDGVYDRYYTPSGDSLPNLLSDEKYRGGTDQFRDISNIRGVGLRLPMIGVGWGYTTEGLPWPSGNWSRVSESGFKGPNGSLLSKGWQVDPTDYIAAPIDFRYDRNRHVWTAPKGFWAEITSNTNVTTPLVSAFGVTIPSGINIHAWKELQQTASGLFTRPSGLTGTITGSPRFYAIESNNNIIDIGNHVWIETSERTDSFIFTVSSSLPRGSGIYKVLMRVDERRDGALAWDYPRFH
jgi:hypothetical protein